MSRAVLGALAVVAAVAALGAGEQSAVGATFLVTTTEDLTKPNPKCEGPCSLRQVVANASQFTGGETKNIVEVPPGTYVLGEQLNIAPPVGKTEEVVGLGSRAGEVKIEPTAARKGRLLNVGTTSSSGLTVVADLELKGGETQGAGAGINLELDASLSLVDVAILDNVSASSGGGINAAGELHVLDSLVAGNKAGFSAIGSGGGIELAQGGQTASLVNSTIVDNETNQNGGGIDNHAQLEVLNTTIAGNTAPTGAGAGISGTAVTLSNSLLARNTPANCAATLKVTETVGHNLADDASCNLGAAGDKQAAAQLEEAGGALRLADNGGPTETIALQPTSPAVGAALGESCPALDQRGVERPRESCDIGAFQLSTKKSSATPPNPKTSTQSSPQTPPPPPPPTPIRARTGNVAPASGTVLVELPGTHTFVALTTLRSVPFGTVIDATHGRVVVTTAAPHGGTQTGEFFGGELVLTQNRDGEVQAALTGGDFTACPTAAERAHRASMASAGKHPVRKLWTNAHGSFSTKGNYAAGAVQGTEWLTEDFCNGTLVRVTRDKVLVTDLVNHHHFLVHSGHSHFAKAPRR